jgi:phosphatidylglycerol:prolipoprotein diacylglycerol transferase
MRSVLLTIPLDGRIDLGPLGKVPIFGCGLALGLWCLIGAAYAVTLIRRHRWQDLGSATAIVWLVIALAIFKAPDLVEFPIYGYGMMLFVGFLAAVSLAAWRIGREEADADIAWDVAMWLFVSGILGGRIYYVATHSDQFFGIDPATGQPRTFVSIAKALVNLSNGGLVLYGSVMLAPVAYFWFCKRRRVSGLALGDIAIASVFVGLAFGRLGCFLHGCCYGDLCSLPWGVEFPKDSVPFVALVNRGLQSSERNYSLALHPTQLYDSLNAVLLAFLTYAYYPFRRRSGEVLAIGWMLYPINRFLIEFLRSDEPAVSVPFIGWKSPLTGAQWVSLCLFALAVAFALWLRKQPALRRPLVWADLPEASVRPPRDDHRTPVLQRASGL